MVLAPCQIKEVNRSWLGDALGATFIPTGQVMLNLTKNWGSICGDFVLPVPSGVVPQV